MMSGPVRLKSVGLHYKPRCAAVSQKTVREMITFHKRHVRHAAKQYLRTGTLGDWNRMHRQITNWDFD
jgi:hypothetical protein